MATCRGGRALKKNYKLGLPAECKVLYKNEFHVRITFGR
jgi:hypothetical protein